MAQNDVSAAIARAEGAAFGDPVKTFGRVEPR
jgi:hypothetical protein